MADGIIQFIKLQLDRQALKQLEKDAGDSSKRAAQAIANEISGSGSAGRAVHKFTGDLRDEFEKDLVLIRKKLANGLIDLPEAEKQAHALADTFNKELEKGLKKAGKGLDPALQAKLLGAAKIDAQKLAVDIRRSLTKEISGAFSDAFATAQGKMSSLGMFSLANVPAQRPLSNKEDKAMLSKAKGDRATYNNLVQRTLVLEQLEGVELTKLGKLFNWLGINVNKASADITGLTSRLANLGVAKGKINAALPVASGGFMKLSGSIMAAAKSLGLFYTLYQAANFLKAAVQKNADLEASWAKLSITVSDFGLRLDEVKPQVDGAIAQGLKLGYTQQQTIDIIARLTQITGDFKKSMKALPAVLDLTAAGYMTMEQAMRQVGRAMIGDVTQMQRYGIFLEKNVDVIDQLTGRFGGEAAAKAKTFRGMLDIVAAGVQLVSTTLGAAVVEGFKMGSAFQSLGDGFGLIIKMINQNRQAIGIWAAVFLRALLGVGVVLVGVIGLFLRITSAVMIVGVGVGSVFRMIPNVIKLAFASIAENMLRTMRLVSTVLDKVFHTDMVKNLDATLVKVRALKAEAQIGIGTVATESGQAVSEIASGTPLSPEIPTQKPTDTKHPRARYLQNVSSEISASRKVALGDDEEKSIKVMERLAVLREELVKQSEELAENDRAALDYNSRIADIDRIRDSLAKKRLATERASKEEAELTRKINILGNIALGLDLKNRRMALEELAKLHDALIIKRDKLNIKSDKYWQTQNHIKEIEDRIAAVTAAEDEKFDKKLKKLGQQVDLQINQVDAVNELLTMYREEEIIANNLALTDDERIKAKLRMLQIETAMRNETDVAAAHAKELMDQLEDPNTRAMAERQLITLRDQLNAKLAKGLVVSTNIKQTNATILSINDALDKSGLGNLRTLDRQLSNAEQLARKYKTRKIALAEFLRIEEEINEALAKGNLTVEERAKLIAQVERAKRGERATGEPNLNVAQDFMKVIREDVPDAFATAANESARVFQTAFTYILRDARNLSHALSSIPKGMAAAMLDEIAKIAEGKVKEHLAWALTETAFGLGATAIGNFKSAGVHFASAGEHVAAAAAWGLVGGAVGSLGVSAHKAYENATDFVPGNATGNRGSSADSLGKIGPDIYITFDPLDPYNPRHQDLIGTTSAKYQERYGGRIILRAAGAR